MRGGALGYTESFLAHVRRRPLEAGLPPVGAGRNWGPEATQRAQLLRRSWELLSEETLSYGVGADYRESMDPGVGRAEVRTPTLRLPACVTWGKSFCLSEFHSSVKQK